MQEKMGNKKNSKTLILIANLHTIPTFFKFYLICKALENPVHSPAN